MKYLSHTVHDAKFQPAELFTLKRWDRSKKDGCHFYGQIKANQILFTTSRFSNCSVELQEDLRDEITAVGFPGGFFVRFDQLTDMSWLVSFNAERILASRYLRLTNDDMMELIRASGLY